MRKSCIAGAFCWMLAVSGLLLSQSTQATPGQPGTLDTAWGAAGVVNTDFFGLEDVAFNVAQQRDGKIVVAGHCDRPFFASTLRGFCVTRYLPDGSLDAGFAESGKLFHTVSFQGFDQARAIALQPDGKLVVAGMCTETGLYQFCLARYNSIDGSFDLSFGDGRVGYGKVATQPSIAQGGASAVAIQPDGKIVLAGRCLGASGYTMCVLRYDASGKLDVSFNQGLPKLVSIGRDDEARAVIIQADGRILIAGTCTTATFVFCGARFESTGQLDPSFGSGGRVVSAPGEGGDSGGYAAAIQADGKMVVAGICNVDGLPNFCAVRYDIDGNPDIYFNRTGTVGFDMSYGLARAVSVQPDGKIVLAGPCRLGTPAESYCAIRLRSDGGLDKTFNKIGFLATAMAPATNVSANGMTLQLDGKVVVAGNCAESGSHNFCVRRFEGGPFGAQNCKLDLDGDGSVFATTDLLIATRVARGVTGDAVTNGITLSPMATRKTWSQIRQYLVSQCGLSLPIVP